jgi:hypothetical protein
MNRTVPALLALALAACAAQPTQPPLQAPWPAPADPGAAASTAVSPADPAAGASTAAHPADAFLAALAQYCGQAFAGRVVVDVPATGGPDPFATGPLVMHVRGCDDPAQGLRVPFHVGADRSRTWVLARTAQGLHLAHDHRHADGTPDVLTLYGGTSTAPGSARRQEFPVDAYSIDLFMREGSAASTTNTWAMELEPGHRFVYELSRPGGRLFRVEFDLTAPVAPPPPPWGDASG